MLNLHESWGELAIVARVIQLLHKLCIVHVLANIVSILGTGDTAIVGNLHPSLENNTYHTVHDIGLQLVHGALLLGGARAEPCKPDICSTYMLRTLSKCAVIFKCALGFSCQRSLQSNWLSCIGLKYFAEASRSSAETQPLTPGPKVQNFLDSMQCCCSYVAFQ
jgi:hypothetical protein